MAFDRTYEGGRSWGRPKGADRDLLRLVRYRINRNVVELAGLVQTLHATEASTAERTALAVAFATFRRVPPGVLSRIARHPSFSYWLSAVKHLMRVASGVEKLQDGLVVQGSTASILEHHLHDLQRFAGAARIVALESFGQTLNHVNPGPLVFPTTGIAIDGVNAGAAVDLLVECGIADCRITVRQAERSITLSTDQPWALRDVPRVTIESAQGMRLLTMYRVNGSLPGYEIDPWDPYCRLAWVRHEAFPDKVRAPMASEGDLVTWHSTLQTATNLLRRHHPDLAAEVSAVICSLIPISSPDSAKSLSVTAPEFWGAIQCSLDPAPMMCEVLVHEYRHNLLHVLNDLDPIFKDDSPSGDRFYSPWRDDARPLSGILHALFTFLGVVTFYTELLKGTDLTAQNRRAASRRTAAHAMRLRLGAREFEKARLTDFGRGLFDGIRDGIGQAADFASTLDRTQVGDAIEAVLHHAEQRGGLRM